MGREAPNFDFSDDQDAIRDAARRFARERLAPNYKAHDTQKTLSKELMHEMGELALIVTLLPEEVGGLGQDYVTKGIPEICGGRKALCLALNEPSAR